MIEMRLGPDGMGEGRMSLFTKIVYEKNKNQIGLENFASQPGTAYADTPRGND